MPHLPEEVDLFLGVFAGGSRQSRSRLPSSFNRTTHLHVRLSLAGVEGCGDPGVGRNSLGPRGITYRNCRLGYFTKCPFGGG